MTDDNAPKRPSHLAYQVSQGRDGQAWFNRIGAAFQHRDGAGFDVVLNSVPVDGRVTLRTAQERLEQLKADKQSQHDGNQRDPGIDR